MSTIDGVSATPAAMVVTVDGRDTSLSWRWVRDHGEDDASFDADTKQRRVYAIGSDAPVPATSAELSQVSGAPTVLVTWPDLAPTWISQATLRALIDQARPIAAATELAQPWLSSPDVGSSGTVQDVLSGDAALAGWVRDIAIYGFAKLSGFSGGHQAVDALASRIGYVSSTIFGTTWDLKSDLSDHADTAFSQDFLAPHTDGTYSHEAPGLQMFCCIERTGTGGESVVVDAFAIAETLRADFPDDFDVLTKVSVPGHYVEPGVELRASRPAIRLDQSGSVVQVSMNNYDRSPMMLPAAEMDAFYRAYGRLHDLANDRDRWHSIRLEPGDVLINDNWRVLHGPEAYTGARHFIGCYLNHEDFESRIRTLNL